MEDQNGTVISQQENIATGYEYPYEYPLDQEIFCERRLTFFVTTLYCVPEISTESLAPATLILSPLPDQVTNLRVEPDCDHYQLHWDEMNAANESQSTSSVSYQIKITPQTSDDNGETQVLASSQSEYLFMSPTASPDQRFQFQVAAVNCKGEGADSEVVIANRPEHCLQKQASGALSDTAASLLLPTLAWLSLWLL